MSINCHSYGTVHYQKLIVNQLLYQQSVVVPTINCCTSCVIHSLHLAPQSQSLHGEDPDPLGHGPPFPGLVPKVAPELVLVGEAGGVPEEEFRLESLSEASMADSSRYFLVVLDSSDTFVLLRYDFFQVKQFCLAAPFITDST